jgi:hypothetical protein
MYFSSTALLLGLVASSIAVPFQNTGLKARQAITPQSYADFQVSDGVAGNALAEVNAKFPVSPPFSVLCDNLTSDLDRRPCNCLGRRSSDPEG